MKGPNKAKQTFEISKDKKKQKGKRIKTINKLSSTTTTSPIRQ